MKPNQLKQRLSIIAPFMLLLLCSLWHNTTQAQCSEGINQTFAILNFGSGNVYYNLQSTSGNPNFEDANLGSFCPYGTLILEGGQNQVYKCNGADIWQNQIWYRIYLTSASPTGAFTPITEYYQSGYSNGCGGADQTWEANGANINVLSGLSAGTYYLEVYSTADYQYCGSGTIYASNNSYNYRATFTVNPTPTVTVNNPRICAGSTATLTATGGTSYVWNSDSTRSSITTNTAGTYTVTATNSSGCTASASGTVVVNPNPTAYAGDDTFVDFVSNVVLGSSSPIGGTPPYTFAWTPGTGLSDSTTQFPVCTPLATTKYYLTVTDSNGCTNKDSVIVAFNKGNNPLTDIRYSAQNLVFTDSGQYLQFDLYGSDTPSNLLFSAGQVYLVYDTNYFGAALINSGAITVTKGQAIDSPYYNLVASDSTRNMIKLSITHSANPTSLANLDSISQQLCHFKFRVASVGTPFVNFDSILMVGASLYQRTATSIEAPYDLVQVSGLVGSLRSSTNPISYQIANANFISPGTLTFDVQAQSFSGWDFYSADVIIDYSTFNFGTDVAGNGLTCTQVILGDDGSGSGGTGSSGGNKIYDLSAPANVSPSAFEIQITGNTYYQLGNINYSPIVPDITSYTTLATCSLTVLTCTDSAATGYLFIDGPSSSGGLALDTQGFQEQGSYDTVIVGTNYTNGGSPLCSRSPYVSGLSPECIGAGSFDVLTITGHDFGTDTGYVYFTNADTSGGFTVTQKQDIRLWSDGEIDLLIPSYPGTAAGGVFYVQTAAGSDNSADSGTNKISIDYANYNTRPTSNYARFVYLDTSMVFQLDTTLFNTPGVKTTILDVMADMNCQTGLNFQLDTIAPSIADTSSSTDHINLISIQPSSGFSDPTAGAQTKRGRRFQSCPNSLPEYNNSSDYQYDVDIEIESTAPSGTWLWSDASLPTPSQLDFASVIAHELGHAAMLNHTLPISRDSGNVMNPTLLVGHYLRNYDNDPNDILGVKHALALGVTLGTAGGCPYAIQTFPTTGGCPTVNPVSCVSSYTTLGINEVTSAGGTFSAYLYPNPYQGNSVIHIDVSEYTDFNITIFDVVGHLVSQSNISSSVSFDISLSDFNQSAGLYLIQVADPHNKVVLKLIKL